MPKSLKLKLTPTREITTKGEIRRIERAIAVPAGQCGPKTYIAMSAATTNAARNRVLAVGTLRDVKARINEAVAAVEKTDKYWGWKAEDLRNLRLYGPYDVPPDAKMETFDTRSTGSVCYHDFTSEFWCPTDGGAEALLNVEMTDIVSIEMTVTFKGKTGLQKTTIELPPNADTITIGQASARTYISEHYPATDAPLYQALVDAKPARPAAKSSRSRKR